MYKLSLFSFIFLLIFFLRQIQCRNFEVRDAADLRSALDHVLPGDVIDLIREAQLPFLQLKGPFEITRNGTPSAPIYFNGHPNISFTLISKVYPESAILLNANYWVLNGILISGDYDARGLEIKGNFNKITQCEIKDSLYGIIVQNAKFNEIRSNRIIDCWVGILFEQANENLLENCDLIQTNGNKFTGITSIHIGGSRENTIKNNRVSIWDRHAKFLLIESPGSESNRILGNLFELDPLYRYVAGYPTIFILYDPMGVFEGNQLIDGSFEMGKLVYIAASNYTLTNNTISTSSSTPFTLSKETSGVKFEGNQMEFLEKMNPETFCIVGEPGIQADNTEIQIGNNNICTNGKLTNIFEK